MLYVSRDSLNQAQDLRNAMSLEKLEKARWFSQGERLLSLLSGLGKCFEIRDALALETHPMS